MLSWEDVRLFLVAWEAGSFTEAAKVLGVGQATLSRRIAGLEATVGHALFDRTRGGLVPTTAAHVLHPHAETMAAGARAAEAALQGLEAEPEGVVRLAVPPGFAVDVVPHLLLRLAERHPGVRVNVLSDTRVRDVGRHEADLALRNIPPRHGDLVWRRVMDLAVGIWASAEYVDALPEGVEAGELAWLQYNEELAHIPQAVYVEQVLAGRPPALWTNDFLTMQAAARVGLGCMIMPDVQGALCGLRRVPVELPNQPRGPMYLVVHRALRNVPRVAAVVAVIDEMVAELAAGNSPLLL